MRQGAFRPVQTWYSQAYCFNDICNIYIFCIIECPFQYITVGHPISSVISDSLGGLLRGHAFVFYQTHHQAYRREQTGDEVDNGKEEKLKENTTFRTEL